MPTCATLRAAPARTTAAYAAELCPGDPGHRPADRGRLARRRCAAARADPPAACERAEPPWSEGLHAHNDYLNGRPLDDALHHGATSVEADVYVDGPGRLMVGHGRAGYGAFWSLCPFGGKCSDGQRDDAWHPPAPRERFIRSCGRKF